MNKQFTSIVACSFLLVLSGCSAPVDSKNLKTSGFYSFINISGTGSSAEVRVSLKSGKSILSSDLELAQGDSLTVTTGSNSKVLSKDGFPVLGITYVATVPYTAGSLFTVALNRTDGENAPASTAVMPEDFNITSPANNTIYTPNNKITISWGPSVANGKITIDHSETCNLSNGAVGKADHSAIITPDTGSYVFSYNTLFPSFTDSYGNPEPISSCNSKIKLSRIRSGTLDSNLGGGAIQASQDRWVNLTLM